MAKKGFMIEKNMDGAMAFTGVGAVDIDGGTLVTIGDVDNYGRYQVTKQASGLGKYIALNPSEHFVKIGDSDVMVAQPTVDPREYTNLAGRSIDLRLLELGMKVGLTAGNIKTGETVAEKKYLEASADGYTVEDSATASTTSLYVEKIVKMPFPQKGIGNEYADVYVCRVVQ